MEIEVDTCNSNETWLILEKFTFLLFHEGRDFNEG